MIYDKEWKHYRRTNFGHPQGLLTFPAQKSSKQPPSTIGGIMQQIRYFTMNIHGVGYIWESGFRWLVRFFWLLVVTAAVLACFTMYLALSSHHSKRQMKTVVGSSQMPIYSIHFPAVALCSWTHVNWMRYKAAEERFLPPNAGNKTKQLFYDLLMVLDVIDLSQLDNLALLEHHTPDAAIDKIPLHELVDFVAFRCEEFFVECFFDETKYDCCKIFVGERTEKGYCMVFNSMVSEESRKKQINDKFYPWKNRKAGEGSGLQFTLRYNKTFANPQTKRKFGMYVLVKQCEEWSVTSMNLFLRNMKTYLAVTPIISETLPNTRHFAPEKRNCLFPDEESKRYDRIENLAFNKVNCIVKCQLKNFIKICNCTLSWFFPKVDVRSCTVADFDCIYKNRDIITYVKSPLQDDYIKDTRRGVVCDCVNSCTSLVFLTNSHANKLPNPNSSYPMIKGDIYIGQSVITKYETRLHSTPFNLIAKFGGILGLCMGASVLSLAEIIYGALKTITLLIFGMIFQPRKVKAYAKKNSNKISKEIRLSNCSEIKSTN